MVVDLLRKALHPLEPPLHLIGKLTETQAVQLQTGGKSICPECPLHRSAACDRRHRRRVAVPLSTRGGFIGGILFIWNLIPRPESLPRWTTFEASVNAEKYGIRSNTTRNSP